MLNLLRRLMGVSRTGVAFSVAASLLAGIATSGLLAIINEAATSPGRSPLRFVIVLCLAIGMQIAAGMVLSRLTKTLLLTLRYDLCQRILLVPLASIERVGSASALASLTDDVPALAETGAAVPAAVSSLTMLATALAYLCWLSWRVFSVWLGMSILAAVGVVVLLRMLVARQRLARAEGERLYEMFRGVVEGAKELRLDRAARESYLHAGVEATAISQKTHAVAVADVTTALKAWIALAQFMTLAAIVFLFDRIDSGAPSGAVSAYVVIVIYSIGPIQTVMELLMSRGRAIVAAENLDRLGLQLNQTGDAPASASPPLVVEEIELDDIVYTHYDEKNNRSFVLGPVDLHVAPGKILFIVGGNGSGKSSLAKVLAGLYVPDAGSIRINGRQVTEENRDWYRQHFSAILANFYLFDRLWNPPLAFETRAQQYLRLLELSDRVRLEGTFFSTTALSQGQRKRLALVAALLADRPIYLFDEWAADQDPTYKRVFYREILPELKRRGKIVVAISHDEAYFDVADEIVKMDEGRRVDEATVQFMQRIAGGLVRRAPGGSAGQHGA